MLWVAISFIVRMERFVLSGESADWISVKALNHKTKWVMLNW